MASGSYVAYHRYYTRLVGRLDVHRIRLIFWDLGGQRDLQNLWDKVMDVMGTRSFLCIVAVLQGVPRCDIRC